MKLSLVTIAVLAANITPLQAQQPLAGASFYSPPSCSVSPFSDVSAADSYCPWIRQLKTDGITAGCGGGAFCPEAPVTRAQMAMLLEKAMRGTNTWDPWSGIFKRILIVNPVPNDYLASGARLLSVVGSISGSTSANSYLVLVEPGRYDLDGEQLVMPPYTTLRGAGIERTEIHSDRSGSAILAGTDTVIESVEVWNTGPGGQVVGIDFLTGSSGTVRNASVHASGGSVCVAIRCTESCTIEDSKAQGSCSSTSTGIYVSGGATETGTLRRVEAKGIFGTTAHGMYFSGARGVVEGGSAEATFADNNFALNVVANASVKVRDLVTDANNNDATDTSAGARLQSGGRLLAANSRFESDDIGGNRYGLLCVEGDATIHDSQLIGANATIFGDSDCTIDVAGTQLAGGPVDDNGGTVRCALNYSENLNVPATTGCF